MRILQCKRRQKHSLTQKTDINIHFLFFKWWRAPQQTLQTHCSLEAYCATLWWRWWLLFFVLFLVMEHQWNKIDRGKLKNSGEKLVPVPLCPLQIPHGLTRDRTRASAVGGPAANRLSHGTAFTSFNTIIFKMKTHWNHLTGTSLL
jgi:hypothetical protein